MWDEDDELDDHEYPDDEEGDDEDDETIPCPHCREPVYEDAERCPSCGQYLSREDMPWDRPLWLVEGVALCLAIVLSWNYGPFWLLVGAGVCLAILLLWKLR